MTRYKKIKLKDGSTINEHQYIMEQHLGRKLSKNEIVHHIDNDSRNNDISNLQLMTRSEHIKLHQRLGEIPVDNGKKYCSKSVLQLDLNGKIIKEYSSTMDAEKDGHSNKRISDCCLNKIKTHHGFKWKYK